VSSRVDAATASNGMDRPQLNQRNRTGLDPHSIPAARLKACTTIQFSKTGALRGKRKHYRSGRPLSIGLPFSVKSIFNNLPSTIFQWHKKFLHCAGLYNGFRENLRARIFVEFFSRELS
jgi:hypothetical protein